MVSTKVTAELEVHGSTHCNRYITDTPPACMAYSYFCFKAT